MIPEEIIQQIYAQVDIVDIVGGYVKLRKRGISYLGLCPFHHEKTPSFTVSASKAIYKCFGCGKSGNAITFLMEHEKFSYIEAVRWLAKRYGIALPERELTAEQRAQHQLADSLYIVNQFAKGHFQQTLSETEEGISIGSAYFLERGFSPDSIKKFELGYSSRSKQHLLKAALEKGYSQQYLQQLGLVTDRNDELVDTYRGRVIFPIHGLSGKVLGFGARILETNVRAPKYINSPENEIYHKSKVLYGLYFSRHAIARQDECLLVEGYTDVISMHQVGLENVVASSGTSLTIDQLRAIRKFTPNLVIIYDGDSAGIKAALRGLEMAIDEAMNVWLVLLPEGEDPDSYSRKLGAEGMRRYVAEHKEDFILFKLRLSLQEAAADPAKKTQLVRELASIIAKMNRTEDFIRRQEYISRCAQELKIEEQGLIQLVAEYVRQIKGNVPALETPVQATDPIVATPDMRQEIELVRVLLLFGDRMMKDGHTVIEFVFGLPFDFEQLVSYQVVRHVLQAYREALENGELLIGERFCYDQDPQVAQLALQIYQDIPESVSPAWENKLLVPREEEDYETNVRSAATYLAGRKVKRMIIENQLEMEHASTYEQQLQCVEIHQYLKQLEVGLAQESGITIFRV